MRLIESQEYGITVSAQTTVLLKSRVLGLHGESDGPAVKHFLESGTFSVALFPVGEVKY
jgi:hypothetical protein